MYIVQFIFKLIWESSLLKFFNLNFYPSLFAFLIITYHYLENTEWMEKLVNIVFFDWSFFDITRWPFPLGKVDINLKISPDSELESSMPLITQLLSSCLSSCNTLAGQAHSFWSSFILITFAYYSPLRSYQSGWLSYKAEDAHFISTFLSLLISPFFSFSHSLLFGI